MKNILLKISFALLISFGISTFQSCDKCKNVECQNGGECDKGKCTCPAGFTGDNCELCNGKTCQNGGTCNSGTCNCATGYYSDDCSISCSGCSTFVRDYKSYSQYCNIVGQYTSSISVSTTASNKISISNFNNKGWTVLGDVSGSSFTIAAQTFTDALTSKQWKIETTSAATIATVNGTPTLTIPVKLTDISAGNPSFCSFMYYKL